MILSDVVMPGKSGYELCRELKDDPTTRLIPFVLITGLSDRERAYAVVASEPYLLVVTGGEVCLSGIENVGAASYAELRLGIPDGRYAVRSTIVAWDDEPGALDAQGRPSADALPDFVLEIQPERGTEPYRTNELTFDAPK